MYGYPDFNWDFQEIYGANSPWRTSARPFVQVAFEGGTQSSLGARVLPYRTLTEGSPYDLRVWVEDPSGRFTHAKCTAVDVRVGNQGWRSVQVAPNGLDRGETHGWSALFNNVTAAGIADWQTRFWANTAIEIAPNVAVRIRLTLWVRDRNGVESEHKIEGDVAYRFFEHAGFVLPHA